MYTLLMFCTSLGILYSATSIGTQNRTNEKNWKYYNRARRYNFYIIFGGGRTIEESPTLFHYWKQPCITMEDLYFFFYAFNKHDNKMLPYHTGDCFHFVSLTNTRYVVHEIILWLLLRRKTRGFSFLIRDMRLSKINPDGGRSRIVRTRQEVFSLTRTGFLTGHFHS